MNKKKKKKKKTKQHQLLTAGLPFVFFSVLAAWVVSNALQGKLKERETAHGVTSQSLRQASLQVEHDETMEKMNKIVASQDFDNTKRIKRPEEILQERKRERECVVSTTVSMGPTKRTGRLLIIFSKLLASS